MAENPSTPDLYNANRPLSPHLTIYKPQISSMLSISHRITGAFLSAGAVIFVIWLWSAAYHPNCFATLAAAGKTWWGMGLLMAWSFAFFYHFTNGIRHLIWDMGYGFELDAANRSGIITVAGSIIITAFVWYMLLTK